MKKFGSLLRVSLVSAGVCHVVWHNVLSVFCLTGKSMLPTLKESDVVVCDRRWWRQVEKGDIVVAKNVQDEHSLICKRVVAKTGDLVLVKDGFTEVPEGYVWLEGDNSYDSYDSRYYGPVPADSIRGKVILRIWPLSQVRTFSKTDD